uniref:Uncharacterized protein n=1 Tax=Arundo donax TaxID=35708 RepID=A0A0A9DIJ4_ARUDO
MSLSQSRLRGEAGGEGADGIENREAIAAAAAANAVPPEERRRRQRVVVAGVAAGYLDPLDELLEALVVDEGALPLGDDAGLVLPRELHHPQQSPPPANTALYVLCSDYLASISEVFTCGARDRGRVQGQAGVMAEAILLI